MPNGTLGVKNKEEVIESVKERQIQKMADWNRGKNGVKRKKISRKGNSQMTQ